MCFLRVAAVIIGLGAVPILFASAETLSSRARGPERHAASSSSSDRAVRPIPEVGRRQLAESAAVTKFLDTGSALDRGGAPTFGRIVIDPNGVSSFEGRSAPGAEVNLTIDAKPLGVSRADESGVWRLGVPAPLTAGDHAITASSRSGDRQRIILGQEIRIAIPEAFAGQAVVAYEAPPARMVDAPANTDRLRSRAEDLAAAASQRFTEVTESVTEGLIAQPLPKDQAVSTDQTVPKDQALPKDAAPAKEPTVPKDQVQAPVPPNPPPQSQPAAKPEPAGPVRGERIAAPMFDWLEYSAREYQRSIVKPLSAPGDGGGGSPTAPARQTDPHPTARPSGRVAAGGSPADVVTDVQLSIQEWLARANRTYQTDIVRRLQQPTTGAGLASPSTPPAVKPAAKVPVPAKPADTSVEPKTAVAEAPKPAAVAADTPAPKPIEQVVPVVPAPVATPVATPSAADEAAKRARDAEAQKQAAEANRRAEEAARQKVEEEARQRTAEAKRAEAKRLAEQQRIEAEAKRLAEQKAAAEAQKRASTLAPPATAGKAEADASTKAADLTRKAVEAARSGATRRATETQPSPEPAAPRAASGALDTKPAPARLAADGARPQPQKPAPRAKDNRVPEGSGEKGPVDPPETTRSGTGKSARANPSGKGDPADGDRGGRTVAVQSSGGRTCARAGRDIRPPGTYVIGSGDTLSEIAERHYGTARRMWRIVKANRRKLRDPDFIRVCQRIWLP